MILIPVKGHLRGGKQVRPHTRLLRRAVKFAERAHRGQFRADGVFGSDGSVCQRIGGMTYCH